MYNVIKETYDNKLIQDFGAISKDALFEIGQIYIGEVFIDNEDILKSIDFIDSNGSELWLCNNNIQISIEKEV